MYPSTHLNLPVEKELPLRGTLGDHAGRIVVQLVLAFGCILIWLTYTGGYSPWIRLNLPGGVHGHDPVCGYTSLYNGDFHHKENFYALQHMDLIKGNYESFSERIGFCDRRSFYAILGNTLTLVLSSYHALRLLNLLIFLLCTYFVQRMTGLLFNDWHKSIFAAVLFICSTMASVHVGDLSPHFLAIAFFYGWGILMIQLSRRQTVLDWRENLGHSALLGLWSLTYTSFAFGLVVYLLVLLRRKEWRLLVAPVAICLVIPNLQLMIIRTLGFGFSTDVERILMSRGLSMHWENLRNGPLSYPLFLGVEFINYLVNDNPVNVLIGLTVLISFKHPSRWVLLALYLVPIAVVFPCIGTTTARGYVVSGNTIVLFPLVAHGVIEAGRWLKTRVGFVTARAAVLLTLLVQIAWGQGSLFDWNYPTGSFGMGILKHSLTILPTEFARMTGDISDKPTLLGGNKPSGAYFGPGPHTEKQPVFPADRLRPWEKGTALPQFLLSGLLAELPVLLCVGIVLLFNRPTWWRRPMTASLLLLIPATLLFGAAKGVDHASYRKFEDQLDIHEGESLEVSVKLSPEFQSLLRQTAMRNKTAEINVHYRRVEPRCEEPADLTVFGHSTTRNRLTMPLEALMTSLDQNDGVFKCSITPRSGSGGILFKSWQLNRPEEGRAVSVLRADGHLRPAEWFPSLEIRVLRGENNYPFKRLCTRWDPARSVGYAVIGF